MSKITRGGAAFASAVAATYVLATAAATQAVMASLAGMGVAVGFADRVATTLADQLGMLGTFAPLLTVALALGFAVTALVCRWLPGWRMVGYPLAGFLAIVVMHMLLRLALEITPVAAARTFSGLFVQGLAGGIGGAVFYLVVSRGNDARGLRPPAIVSEGNS